MRTTHLRPSFIALALLALPLGFAACGGSQKEAEPPVSPPATSPVDAEDEPLPPPAYEAELPEAIREAVTKVMLGDLDEMLKRRLIRIGVAVNRTAYFVDKGVQRGTIYDYGRLLEEQINTQLNTGNMKVFVTIKPLPREELLRALLEGKVDLVAAQLTVGPELQKVVDFTNPTRKDVSEIVVTGPGVPAMASAEDLSGRSVYVRSGGSYHESLSALNDRLKSAGRPLVDIRATPVGLEDDDVLEMVNAGLIPATVVDDYLARFWTKVFPNLVLHEKAAVRTGGMLAVAIRKNSPKLAAGLNKFMANYGLGTAFGNQIERKYLVSTKYTRSAASEAERKKFLALVDIFRKYSTQYNMDYLLMGAQGYQESALNHEARSPVGAIGVMQVMPATGKELNVGDITELESNIHAGVKYMRFMIDRYFKDEPMDQLNKGLFAFAAYNAGPGRVRQLRREAEKRGLNPNVWFGNVEQIASERIGRETVTYVSNIYKYYVAYKLFAEESERRAAAKAEIKK